LTIFEKLEANICKRIPNEKAGYRYKLDFLMIIRVKGTALYSNIPEGFPQIINIRI
jgi:hypothetical protein